MSTITLHALTHSYLCYVFVVGEHSLSHCCPGQYHCSRYQLILRQAWTRFPPDKPLFISLLSTTKTTVYWQIEHHRRLIIEAKKHDQRAAEQSAVWTLVSNNSLYKWLASCWIFWSCCVRLLARAVSKATCSVGRWSPQWQFPGLKFLSKIFQDCAELVRVTGSLCEIMQEACKKLHKLVERNSTFCNMLLFWEFLVQSCVVRTACQWSSAAEIVQTLAFMLCDMELFRLCAALYWMIWCDRAWCTGGPESNIAHKELFSLLLISSNFWRSPALWPRFQGF